MTKREMFELIATVNADNDEIVDFCHHEIELLTRKTSRKTPTKTQKENEGIMDAIEVGLAELDEPVTVTDLIKGVEALGGYSNQKISALLRKMVEAGRVVKSMDGKKSLFAIA